MLPAPATYRYHHGAGGNNGSSSSSSSSSRFGGGYSRLWSKGSLAASDSGSASSLFFSVSPSSGNAGAHASSPSLGNSSTARARGGGARGAPAAGRTRLLDRLRGRARLTNLAVGLVLIALLFSVSVNVRAWMQGRQRMRVRELARRRMMGWGKSAELDASGEDQQRLLFGPPGCGWSSVAEADDGDLFGYEEVGWAASTQSSKTVVPSSRSRRRTSWAEAIALRLGRGAGAAAAGKDASPDAVAIAPGMDVTLGSTGAFAAAGPMTPPSIESTIVRPRAMERLNHLVIVAGHAIWKGPSASARRGDGRDDVSGDTDDGDTDDEIRWARERATRGDESDWILTPYQRGNGAVTTFLRHIERGVEEATKDPASLLIFSGGQTRPEAAVIGTTEGQSYLRLASSIGLLGDGDDSVRTGRHAVFGADETKGGDGDRDSVPLAARTTTEDFALDSFQNLLFSVARFREVTGNYPFKVTVVGYEMKRARFETLHRAALRIPPASFKYIGIDDQGDTSAAYEGEVSRRMALEGCRTPN